MMINLTVLDGKPEEKLTHEAGVMDAGTGLLHSEHGVYINFLGREGEARIRASNPGKTRDRLATIKARYDPTNLFRLSQKIPPAVELLA